MFLFYPVGSGFFGFLLFLFAVFILGMIVGFPMFLLQFFSGEKFKFFGLEPGEPIYDKNRHW